MAFTVRPVRPNVFFISEGGGLVDMKLLAWFKNFNEMPNHCTRSDYILSIRFGTDFPCKQHAMLAREGLANCKKSVLNRTK